MISLPVTSLVAGVFALMMVPLSIQVTLRRVKMRARFGDAGDEVLRRRIRAHGNFVEYVPTALIVLALVEIRGGVSFLIWGLGGAFLASRVLHAIGMLYTSTPRLTAIAMFMQHTAFLVSGGWLVFAFL